MWGCIAPHFTGKETEARFYSSLAPWPGLEGDPHLQTEQSAVLSPVMSFRKLSASSADARLAARPALPWLLRAILVPGGAHLGAAGSPDTGTHVQHGAEPWALRSGALPRGAVWPGGPHPPLPAGSLGRGYHAEGPVLLRPREL